jgi:hypothetical protein
LIAVNGPEELPDSLRLRNRREVCGLDRGQSATQVGGNIALRPTRCDRKLKYPFGQGTNPMSCFGVPVTFYSGQHIAEIRYAN